MFPSESLGSFSPSTRVEGQFVKHHDVVFSAGEEKQVII
jgi:hypothetical protein